MASLFSLIPPGEEHVSLDRLEEAVASEDVLVDCLTDEELYWLRGGDLSSDPTMDEPYLSGLAEEARSVAIDSGLRSLIAKGMVDLDPEEPEAMEVVGPYALIASFRQSPESVARVMLDVPGEPPLRYACYRVSSALVLVEEVSDDGFHDFVLQAPESAAAALVKVFDRRRTAGDRSEPWQRSHDRNDLHPSVDALAAGALHTVVAVASGIGASGRPFERLVTIYGGKDGVWVYWGHASQGGGDHTLGRFGQADLYGLATELIVGDDGDR